MSDLTFIASGAVPAVVAPWGLASHGRLGEILLGLSLVWAGCDRGLLDLETAHPGDGRPDAPSAAQHTVWLALGGASVASSGCAGDAICSPLVACPAAVEFPGLSAAPEEAAGLVGLVRDYLAPFDVDVVTERPAQAGYATIVVGGAPTDLCGTAAELGVAPLDCGNRGPDVAFVFSAGHELAGPIATAVVHELGHTLGLEHTNDSRDVMYPIGALESRPPPSFLDEDLPVVDWYYSTRRNPPRGLREVPSVCDGRPTQRSFARMAAALGLRGGRTYVAPDAGRAPDAGTARPDLGPPIVGPPGSVSWVRRIDARMGTIIPATVVPLEDGGFALGAGVFGTGDMVLGPGEIGQVTVSVDGFEAASATVVARYRADGALAWAREGRGAFFGCASGMCSRGALARLSNGELALAGELADQGDAVLSPGQPDSIRLPGTRDNFLARYDIGGQLLGARRITASPSAAVGALAGAPNGGGVLMSGDFVGALTLDPDRPGSRTLSSAGARDAFLARLGAAGGVAWALRGPSDRSLSDVRVVALAGGDIIMFGSFSGTLRLDADGTSPVVLDGGGAPGGVSYLARLSADGRVVWARVLGSATSARVRDVSAWPDGAIAVAGEFTSDLILGVGTTFRDGHGSFIATFAPDGSLVSARRTASGCPGAGGRVLALAGGDTLTVTAAAAGCTLDPEVAPVTYRRDSMVIARTDPEGAPIWLRAVEGPVYGSSAVLLADGAALVSGRTAAGPTPVTFGRGEPGERALNGDALFLLRLNL